MMTTMSHYHYNGDYCSSDPSPDLILKVHPIKLPEREYWLVEEARLSKQEWDALPDYAKPVRVGENE